MEQEEGVEMNTLLEAKRRFTRSGSEKKKWSKLANFFVDESYDERTVGSGVVEEGGERLRWDNFVEYFLSIIGFVIDLGNVWRFPTVCYMNGGGAFLIPFFVCLFLIGMPCMYLELALGQYFQSGNISIWEGISPYMKGIGITVILINVLMLSYYNTLQAYALYYLLNSFQLTVPWSSCDQPWSTSQCLRSVNSSLTNNDSKVYLATSEFFRRRVLSSHLSAGLDDLAGIKWDMLACLFAIFSLTTFCIIRGIKSSGKAVYFTALLPYVCLLVLIFQSFTLDGSLTGLKYYLKPDFSRLLEIEVWLAAAIQIFFSLGPGFGVLITYASYAKKSTRIKNVTISCAIVNCVTSLMYGLVVFSGLGYMAKRLNVGIEHFLEDGIGLVFVVYPEILSTFTFGSVFAVVFFSMLIMLGMDSAFGGMEGLYTAIVDEYAICKRHPFKTRLAISIVPFISALPTVSYGGIYVVQWLDRFAIAPSIFVVVLLETVAVCWLYGSERFYDNLKEMSGRRPSMYWSTMWKYIVPVLLLSIIAFDAIMFQPLEYGKYKFPMWTNYLGYSVNLMMLLPIPALALYKWRHHSD